METITLTLNARGRTRRVTVGSSHYLVVPVTMIVPGVLPGSHGPLYYPADENVKSAHAWNGMPVVVDHPTVNGVPVSARSADVFQTRWVGAVFNAVATEDDPVLRGEAWLDIDRTRAVDPRVLADIEAGRDVEVSTGLNHRCDTCGRTDRGTLMNRNELISFVTANCDCWNKPDDKKVLEAMTDDQLGRVHASVKKSREAPAVNATPTPSVTIPVAVPVVNGNPAPAPAQVPTQVVLTPEMLTNLVGEITKGVIANVRTEGEKANLVANLLAAAPEEHRQALSVTYNALSVEALRPMAAALPPQFLPTLATNFGPAGGVPVVTNVEVDQNDNLPDPDYSWMDAPVRNGKTRVKAD
jgi:hypothetical protein